MGEVSRHRSEFGQTMESKQTATSDLSFATSSKAKLTPPVIPCQLQVRKNAISSSISAGLPLRGERFCSTTGRTGMMVPSSSLCLFTSAETFSAVASSRHAALPAGLALLSGWPLVEFGCLGCTRWFTGETVSSQVLTSLDEEQTAHTYVEYPELNASLPCSSSALDSSISRVISSPTFARWRMWSRPKSKLDSNGHTPHVGRKKQCSGLAFDLSPSVQTGLANSSRNPLDRSALTRRVGLKGLAHSSHDSNDRVAMVTTDGNPVWAVQRQGARRQGYGE